MAPNQKNRRPPAAAKPQTAVRPDRTPVLEWIAAGVGGFVTLGAIGFLAFQGLQPAEPQPALEVAAEAARRAPDGWIVPIRVTNKSRTTAAEVEVEATLALPDGDKEARAITFDYLPGRGNRRGGLSFTHDPGAGEMTLAVKGYVEP